jgi:SAM-dependent methyltransferase
LRRHENLRITGSQPRGAKQVTTIQAPVDEAAVGAFMQRTMGDAAGMMAAALAMLGDRLGLFTALAEGGPATSAELASRAGVSERYAREWLYGMHAAGYLAIEPETGQFVLPAAHAEVLAAEGGPFFLGGAFQLTLGYLRPVDRLIEAFRSGGGVPQSAYGDETWEGMYRLGRTWYENALVQHWLPAAGLADRLQAGARCADIGCGSGLALIQLAQAFPNSTFVGFDSFDGQIERARGHAADAGIGDRVRFELHDATGGIPGRYDLITAFDVLHDAADPPALLRSVHDALSPDGTFLLMEMNCADEPRENVGPVGTLMYGISMLYCMSTSLAAGGAGLGTCGCPPAKVRQLCHEAGFTSVERLPIEDPMNALYAVRR